MAKEATGQICPGEQEANEECENIPPAFILSDTTTLNRETCYATPTSNKNGNGRSGISGLQSALTPVLKYLNIGNKSTSPQTLFSLNNGTIKSNASLSGLSISLSATSGDKDCSTCWVQNENLPEISFLDITCDTPMNGTTNINCDSHPTTPKQNLNVNPNLKPHSTTTPFRWLCDEILPEMTFLDDTCDTTVHLTRNASMHSDSVPGTPACETEMATKQVQILVLNPNSKLNSTLTPETDLPLSEQEPPSLETTHDCSSNETSSSKMSEILEKLSKSEIDQSSKEKISSTFTGNLTHSINSCSEISDCLIVEDVKNAQLQVTLDISTSSVLNSSKTSPVDCGMNGDKIQIADESTLASQPVNVTCDLSSSHEMAVQCHGSQSLASNSVNVTSELQVEPVETSCPEELKINSGLKVANQSTVGFLNNTFPAVQPSEHSTASNQVLNPQNRTMDLSSLNNRSHTMTETQQADLSAKSSTESCDMQRNTFKNSLQNSSGNTLLAEAGATITNLQNTFETKPNGTINYTETSSSDKCKNILEKTSPSPVHNATTTEACPFQVSGNDKIQESTDFKGKTADTPESTSDINPAVEENSEASASSGEAKDSLNGGLALCESLTHQNMFPESYKADTFNLDNTLEFKLDSQFTSTPMSTCKPFSFTIEREGGKTTAVQKKLYGVGPSKPVVQWSSEIPSNIVCNRKTFLPQPATKSHLPTMKAQFLLSKFKPASILPKCTSGRPLTRQAEALKTNAAPDALQQTTEITSFYNLRSTTTALKQPAYCFLKQPLSGIYRPVHAPTPPMAKNTASGSDKPAGATNSQAKKHLLNKVEALPAAKKKKTDPSSNAEAPIFSSDTASKGKSLKHLTHSQITLPTKCKRNDIAVPSTSSVNPTTCETTCRVRTLKLPATGLKNPTAKPLCHGCTNCSVLEEQLKLKDEEIRKLKDELLKRNK